MTEPLLAILPSVAFVDDGARVLMDVKATEGLMQYAALWPGRVQCYMPRGAEADMSFGQWYDRKDLPFDVIAKPADAYALGQLLAATRVVLVAADIHDHLDIDRSCNAPVVFIIEYTPATRRQIVRLSTVSAFQKLKTMVWLEKTERQRKRAFRRCAGLQANGTPAFDAYGAMAAKPMLFFDSRLGIADYATDDDLARKAARFASGATTLRLGFSGRLEAMKGAQDLAPLAAELRRGGFHDFTLDIFGSGVLEPQIRAFIADHDLSGHVALRGVASFQDELLPVMKRGIDLFICCHRQSDPSCTYMETLGCGVPMAGFRNDAFAGVLALGDVGRAVPMGDLGALARVVRHYAENPAVLAAAARAARDAALSHAFESTSAKRIAHVRDIAQV